MPSKFCTSFIRSAQRMWLLFLLSAAFVGSRAAQGQTTFGTITGVVKDPSGAVVSGASVTIANESTSLRYQVTTSLSGVYIEPNLLPGIYSIHAESTGFQPYVTTGVHLNANQTANVDAPLAVANSIVTNVDARDSESVLNTQTATLSTVLVPEELEQMPVITRQKGDEGASGYALFNPDVSDELCGGCGIVANGARYEDAQPTVDGITVMSSMDGVGGSTVQPGLDAVGELDVMLSN